MLWVVSCIPKTSTGVTLGSHCKDSILYPLLISGMIISFNLINEVGVQQTTKVATIICNSLLTYSYLCAGNVGIKMFLILHAFK